MIAGYQPGGFRREDGPPTAEGYRGKLQWWVTRGSTVIQVCAPSEQAAIKTALEHWGLDWRRLVNYGSCTARRCRA